MDVVLSCECGNSVTVTEAAADREIACNCGRTMKVPSFAELRQRAGLPASHVSPAMMISHLLENGELYPPADCVWCSAESDDVLHFRVECERPWVKRVGGFSWVLYLVSPIAAIASYSREETREFGNDITFLLPVTVCPNCRGHLTARRLRHAGLVVRLALLLAGLATVFFRPLIGAALLAAFAVTWLIARLRQERPHDPLKDTLRKVPLYAPLLDRYPDAVVIWAGG
jgi:hypothetical protein